MPDYLYQKEVPVSENIRLTSTVEPVTTVVSSTNTGYSSTPDPAHAEPDSIESDERSEYESSSEEETPEENLPAD